MLGCGLTAAVLAPAFWKAPSFLTGAGPDVVAALTAAVEDAPLVSVGWVALVLPLLALLLLLLLKFFSIG